MSQQVTIFLLILASNGCAATPKKPSEISEESLRGTKFKGELWTFENSSSLEVVDHVISQRQVDDEVDHSNHIENILQTDGDGKQKQVQPPTINFYSSIPNAVGVFCNGMLTLRELSATIGTPLPIWIGFFPMLIFTIAIVFWPDLTTLGLPLFYPNGADGDPLAAFPPLPDFEDENGILAKLLGDLLLKYSNLFVEIK